jgi:hypothetical protein
LVVVVSFGAIAATFDTGDGTEFMGFVGVEALYVGAGGAFRAGPGAASRYGVLGVVN